MLKSPPGTQCLLAGIMGSVSLTVIIYLSTFLLTVYSKLFRFIPPENFNLALLTLELEFVKKGAKDEQVCFLFRATL